MTLGVYNSVVKIILCTIYTLSRTNKFLHTFCFTNVEFILIQLYNNIYIINILFSHNSIGTLTDIKQMPICRILDCIITLTSLIST